MDYLKTRYYTQWLKLVAIARGEFENAMFGKRYHVHSEGENSWGTMVMARMDKPASLFNKSSLFAGIVDKSSGKEMQCTMCIGWFEEWRNEGMNNMIQRMVRLGDFMYI